MKKALILYWHGLGDIIQLTPHLRHLYERGYVTDLLCMEQTEKSKLLDACPYTDKLFSVPNVWKSPIGFNAQVAANVNYFNSLKDEYNWSGKSNHIGIAQSNKVNFTSKELGIVLENKKQEVFISNELLDDAYRYVEFNYPKGFIYVHTQIEEHTYHNWNPYTWIKNNLPDLPVVDTGVGMPYYKYHDNINFTFALIKLAKYRVLSSSVMVHAADALGVTIDVINYGRADRKVWLEDMSKVINIRENNQWLQDWNV